MIPYRDEGEPIPFGLSWQWHYGPQLHYRRPGWKVRLGFCVMPWEPWYKRYLPFVKLEA